MDFTFDEAGLDRYHRESPELRELLMDAAEIGAAFWTDTSHRRTGFNAESVLARVIDVGGYPEGEVYAHGYYARYREAGTRWNAPERVLQQAITVIEGGPY